LPGDGFKAFHREFREAVALDDRKRVARAFAFPFKDEGRELGLVGADLDLENESALLQRYEDFFGPAPDGRLRRPSEYPQCRPDMGGYVDWNWLITRPMLAQRRNGLWKWVMVPYVP
jgi:hypothetical protein